MITIYIDIKEVDAYISQGWECRFSKYYHAYGINGLCYVAILKG